MFQSNLWIGVAAATGVPGLVLLSTVAAYSLIGKSIPGLSKKASFVIRNRMLLLFAGIALLCLCGGVFARRQTLVRSCNGNTITSFGDNSPNLPCNNGVVEIN